MSIFGWSLPPGCHTLPGEEEYNDCCPICGKQDVDWEINGDEEYIHDGYSYCSKTCLNIGITGNLDTPEQHKRIHELYSILNDLENDSESNNRIFTVDELFDSAPNGDFTWEDAEPGDDHVYACGERDCEIGWHKISYYIEMGRKIGKRWVNRYSVDSDGDKDLDCGWDEGEDWQEMGYSLTNEIDEYFKGWAKYYLDCAQNALEIYRSGKDPVEDVIEIPALDEIVDFFIKSAEDKMKYLRGVK